MFLPLVGSRDCRSHYCTYVSIYSPARAVRRGHEFVVILSYDYSACIVLRPSLLDLTDKTLTLNIPDNLEIDSREAAMLLATRLYEQGKLSLGQAAELAGYSKRTFMELLGNSNVSPFNYDEEELENDICNAQRYHH